jgi:hypothetical protein
MGTRSRSFAKTHVEEVAQMKRLLMIYVKRLQTTLQGIDSEQLTSALPGPPAPAVQPALALFSKTALPQTSNGFPILPTTWPEKVRKDDLEAMFSSYMSQHYSQPNISSNSVSLTKHICSVGNRKKHCPGSLWGNFPGHPKFY